MSEKNTLMNLVCVDQYGYEAKDITTLIDSDEVPHECWPTKENIVNNPCLLIYEHGH